MTTAHDLRQLLSRPELVVAPGAYDGMTAKMVEAAGFACVYMTGAGASAARGFPDYGLLSMNEMAEAAGVLARSVGVPVIADADTGYGNELNVTRTVREYEMRGVAGLHIEDQVAPKRCGHLDGKEVIPRNQFVAKIRAALAARHDPAFLVIARTDARAMLGLDEAVERAREALAAGADMVFVEAAQSMEELAAIPRRVEGPCLLNIVRGGKTPDLDLATAQQMGYRLAILPSLLIGAAASACEQALSALRSTGQPPSSAHAPGVAERFRRLGAAEWDALRTRFQAAE
ncbi:carboxyvinyl-carboxyphosphonate phosphorylmutase [Variovorax paradoxus]|jgi:2-methylisocitrate lyase-like PEP mutase family enzyme|uniref:isocitrate lyase/PEP mutase family protein n=1 Tax=Variovorax paradoxus TaxID=34073 RepID=UPI0006E553D4|nr:carboxyvinyl-carboxyphosphonate phosphorylmutase [Variovorax paradoxus]KPV10996.1 carboxyvinyl-carboxyphosphonate phosphorylmutase [Variovorax paradoxus]KPV13497.1 carboxyvinyl-carboxyphosphonate phosphorylmutase [Variovorax paradoxus]KPV24249.1 carboxyvinyl-carboxyphosphonate phosphorylmutase [Variovorax paradoxus]KPV32745.1 carboxyvinyl-carboxyphosphonate phosphorylmutase [Variovorax paradoxus]